MATTIDETLVECDDGEYMEVIITQEDDSEFVYWVDLSSIPEDEDEYDWSIQRAVDYHNTLELEQVSEDNATASEPFSRNETEFTFVW